MLEKKYDSDVIKFAQFSKRNMIDGILGKLNTLKNQENYIVEGFDPEKARTFLVEKINIELIIKNWSKEKEIEAGYLKILIKNQDIKITNKALENANPKKEEAYEYYNQIYSELRDLFLLDTEKLPHIIISNSSIIKKLNSAK